MPLRSTISARVAEITKRLNKFGGCLDPHACFLLERGLKTLSLRWRQQSASAAIIAEWLGPRSQVVYYPGIDYLISLMRSKFYNGIGGGKQLGDTQAIPTVPILDRL